MQMHAFTDPYLNVKLHPCLCQQLNYTIKNGACLYENVWFHSSEQTIRVNLPMVII